MASVAILPVLRLNRDFLQRLKEHLQQIFGTEVVITNSIGIPPIAYNPNRDQYDSTLILRYITPLKKGFAKLLAIAEPDLYSEGLNFVFGEADPVHGVAIISLARLRESFYGQPEDPELFFQRALKEAVHELGHLYRLPHCPDPTCVMHFSNTLKDTDRKQAHFCSQCRAKLEQAQ